MLRGKRNWRSQERRKEKAPPSPPITCAPVLFKAPVEAQRGHEEFSHEEPTGPGLPAFGGIYPGIPVRAVAASP